MVSYPISSSTGAIGTFTCTAPDNATDSSACIMGQDVIIPCTECAGLTNVCLDPCNNCSVRANPDNASLCSNPAPANCSQ
ncbi:MAG: hypothetical protein QM756_23330 [Polyangiaceae bacterium]